MKTRLAPLPFVAILALLFAPTVGVLIGAGAVTGRIYAGDCESKPKFLLIRTDSTPKLFVFSKIWHF